ncbi:MAG: glutamine amidotransferase [Confluentimicrobium sp.]|jgi:GMP synthase (glutamine-hydrolysing)|uniref:type 1 glutamine amidotransferase n=1 Tax=Actibacterium sp. TaxID=1872125 RepID=UPI000C3D180B|nr:type 1 glutamine amidotransferase [Actibacterium sp.]MBC55610.1 glutamine amidotransferase [Actibacterium sp.]
MLIGILETGLVPDVLRVRHGAYPDMFEKLLAGRGFDFRRWCVVDMEFPDTVQEADGWLITGSRHGAYDDLPFIKPLEAFIREAYAAHVPMVGICFGHQIIAQALGGKVEKFSGGWAVGRQEYTVNGRPLALNAWHQDQVTELPDDATVIGSGPSCEYAALAYGDRALSVQPHPEFDAGFIDGLIRERGKGIVPDPLLEDASARLDAPTDNSAMAEMISAFFLSPRKVPHV